MNKTMTIGKSQVSFGHQSWPQRLAELPWHDVSKLFVLVQNPLLELWKEDIQKGLSGLPVALHWVAVEDGEALKQFKPFQRVLREMVMHKGDRKSAILAIGGGVIGDFSGFVAATFMRGIDWLLIPTTLLAQQDASVGGKVAINIPEGKNLVGAFWPPKHVIMDSVFYDSLPLRQQNAGYMELLKHSILKGPDLYQRVLRLPSETSWQGHGKELFEGLQVKAGIVDRDPFEHGERKLLNLGHTLAHAIETFTEYEFLHGEAVGLGLMFSAILADIRFGGWDLEPLQKAVLDRLPKSVFRNWDGFELLKLTHRDKKSEHGVLTWIVPEAPGNVHLLTDISDSDLEEAVQRWCHLLRP